MIQAFLSSLAPNLEQLLVEVSKHISDDMLLEIALADYGLEQKMHLARLRHLRDHGTFVEPMYWYPCEVLELIRNSNPAGSNDIRGHRVRVFACAALLRSKEAPWNKGGDCGTTSYNLVRLLKSIRELPPDFTRYAIQLLAWIMLHSDLEGQDEQAVYCGVGLLWLVLHFDAPPPDDVDPATRAYRLDTAFVASAFSFVCASASGSP